MKIVKKLKEKEKIKDTFKIINKNLEKENLLLQDFYSIKNNENPFCNFVKSDMITNYEENNKNFNFKKNSKNEQLNVEKNSKNLYKIPVDILGFLKK